MLALSVFVLLISEQYQTSYVNASLLIISIIVSFIMLFRSTEQYKANNIDSFVIKSDGSVALSIDQEFVLLPSSRICFWGVLLRLEAKPTSKENQLYIYKDSVSTADYSRLCRIVLRNTATRQLKKP